MKKKAYCLQFYKDIEWGKCYSSKLASHIVFHSVCYVQIEWMLWNYEACSSWMGHFAISDIVYRKIVHTYSVMKNKQIDIIQYKKKLQTTEKEYLHSTHYFCFVLFNVCWTSGLTYDPCFENYKNKNTSRDKIKKLIEM